MPPLFPHALLTLLDSAKGVTKGELVCAALALSYLQGTGRGEVYQLLLELVLEVAVCCFWDRPMIPSERSRKEHDIPAFYLVEDTGRLELGLEKLHDDCEVS